MIKKIAVTASVSGKKYALMPGDTAAPEACPRDFSRKKTRSLERAEQSRSQFTAARRLLQKSGARTAWKNQLHSASRHFPQAKKKPPPGAEDVQWLETPESLVKGWDKYGPDFHARRPGNVIFLVPAGMLHLT